MLLEKSTEFGHSYTVLLDKLSISSIAVHKSEIFMRNLKGYL